MHALLKDVAILTFFVRFNVALEFKEDDTKGNFSTVPKEKNAFKLRCDVEKKIVITVTQHALQRELQIER